MHVLAATDSVHTTAAICDYLGDRCTPEDHVTVVGVSDPADASATRDRKEALNVARVRLLEPSVTTEHIEAADPARAIRRAAAERTVDELVIGANGGDPEGSSAVGSTATSLLANAERPVVVVPFPPVE